MIRSLQRLWIGLALLAGMTTAMAQGNAFTYQGNLAAGGQPANGPHDFIFRLYDAETGGTQIGNTVLSSSLPVTNGIFLAMLDFGPGAFNGQACWLEIEVRQVGAPGFTPLSPRQPITTVPYAILAGGVSRPLATEDLRDGSVTSPKLADGAVTAGKIARDTIVNADVAADAAIADTKLATIDTPGKVANRATTATSANTPGTIVARDASGDFIAGTITATAFNGNGARLTGIILEDGSVTTGKLADEAVTSVQIEDGGVGNRDLADGSVSSTKLASEAVTRGKIARGTIIDADVAADAAIADTKLAMIDTPGKVANRATTATPDNIRDAIVARDAAGDFTAGTITAAGFVGSGARLTDIVPADGSVTSRKLADEAVTSMQIQDGGVSNRDLADGSVSSTKLADEAVTAGKIARGAIGNADIAANAAIADTKLAIIDTPGKVDNRATTATASNVPNTIVERDGNGDFSARVVQATTLTGAQINGASIDATSISGTTLSGNGAGITGLNADNLTSGIVPDARFDAAVARDSEIMPIVLANDGPGSGLDADFLDGYSLNSLWRLSGNAATVPGVQFLGTTDNQPLELKVNGQRALRLEPAAVGGTPNVIGGAAENSVAQGVHGATVGGGLRNLVQTNAHYATIAGGIDAQASNYGQWAYASGGFAQPGDAQTSLYLLRATTDGINTNAVEMFLDGTTNRMVVPENGSWIFEILLVGRLLETYYITNPFGPDIPVYRGSTSAYEARGGLGFRPHISGQALSAFSVTYKHFASGEPDEDSPLQVDTEYRALVLKVSSRHPMQFVARVRTVETINP